MCRGTLCRLLCSALTALPLVFGFLYIFFLVFCFYGCSEVLKELLTAHGKLSKHSTQTTCLPLPSFPVPRSFLLGRLEKPGLLGFGWSACAAFRHHAGLAYLLLLQQGPAGTAFLLHLAQPFSPVTAPSGSSSGTSSSISYTSQVQLLPAFPASVSHPRLSGQLIPLFMFSCFIFVVATGYLFLLSLVLRVLAAKHQIFQHSDDWRFCLVGKKLFCREVRGHFLSWAWLGTCPAPQLVGAAPPLGRLKHLTVNHS